MASFPEIKSKHSLIAKHVTKEKWDKLKDIATKTCGFTLAQVYCWKQYNFSVRPASVL